MNVSALLTSAGINIGICVLLFSLYSILRKQPGNASVYFSRTLAQARSKRLDPLYFDFDRLVPSASWIVKAWETTEEQFLADCGLDAVVFLRIIVFSIRIFSIAAVISIILVLPFNYYGQEMQHKEIPAESLDVFTIGNVMEGSKCFWAHVLALYVISCAACVLLYFEYKSITLMRLAHISESPSNPSHFSVLVRSIPWSSERTYSASVSNFFAKYYASSYLSHQMVLKSGTVQKLMSDAEKMCKVLKSNAIEQGFKPNFIQCGLCGTTTNSFKMLPNKKDSDINDSSFAELQLHPNEKECAAAFVFFKTRHSAVLASQVCQSSNPMSWVTDLAPEPRDVYWSNLCIPYRQLWIRKIITLLASLVFMFVFLLPVTLVQGLTQLEFLLKHFSFLRGILKKKFMTQVVTGYLPSVVLILFLYLVPPVMMLFSAVEGSISRSGRKHSACCKVLYFMIWNVFFVNVLSGSVLNQLDAIFSFKNIPTALARAVPTQASFFMTYVLTSGWASLSCELMQIFVLICNLFGRYVLKRDSPLLESMSFPYHTEVPKVLLFGLLGFTCSILAPLIIPFLLIYFLLAYLVYRNQLLNVYLVKYESGGKLWPIAHNAFIFSLVLAQVIAVGVFGIKRSPVASGFTIPLVILTLLFNEYCRQRFSPIFKNNSLEVLAEMDWQDEQAGRMDEIYNMLTSAYCQFTLSDNEFCKSGHSVHGTDCEPDPESAHAEMTSREDEEREPCWNEEKEPTPKAVQLSSGVNFKQRDRACE